MLARPGEVIRKLRGSAAEQMAAASSAAARRPARATRADPLPRPDRAELDKAEEALAEADAARDKELRGLATQLEALEKRRQAAAHAHDAARAKLEAARDAASEAHRKALEKWRRSSP